MADLLLLTAKVVERQVRVGFNDTKKRRIDAMVPLVRTHTFSRARPSCLRWLWTSRAGAPAWYSSIIWGRSTYLKKTWPSSSSLCFLAGLPSSVVPHVPTTVWTQRSCQPRAIKSTSRLCIAHSVKLLLLFRHLLVRTGEYVINFFHGKEELPVSDLVKSLWVFCVKPWSAERRSLISVLRISS